ncbi:MAG: chemotaxis protein CheW [Cyanobacteria bacterium J06649_4]
MSEQSQEKPCISFSLGDRQYSISTQYLEEIFLLPEVTMISTASPDILGILNFRGDLLPILDPRISLGHTDLSPYKPSDSVIVLNQDQLRIGLIVDKIGQVETINIADIHPITAEQNQQIANAERPSMVAGFIEPGQSANLPTTQWLLNDPAQWLRYVDVQPLMAMQGMIAEPNLTISVSYEQEDGDSSTVFCPEATPEEREIFRQRAQNLSDTVSGDRSADITTLAIVTIEEHRFGIDLLDIKEFAALNKITPVPCCPPHIVGNMNLRGEILTLVDLQALVEDSDKEGGAAATNPAERKTRSQRNTSLEASKAMVVEIDDCVVGILIDEVSESMFSLRQKDLVTEQSSETYLRGKFAYGGQSVPFLNLSQVVSQEGFVVDEVV